MKTPKEIVQYLRDVRQTLLEDIESVKEHGVLTQSELDRVVEHNEAQASILEAVIDQLEPEPERQFIFSDNDDIRKANFTAAGVMEFGWYQDCHYWEVTPDGSYRQEFKKIVGA
jgi:hypothetical protein